ncbi:MAG: hypothetical protein CVV44_11105 [Spirochaetae bacterium HGW-Spirochaetae-1]|jgi:hypothetical protein|nr:MAG: hypothetical protein CVV44_11105 [Spirochaetae bacterium HGW-Spirochaetae-1]
MAENSKNTHTGEEDDLEFLDTLDAADSEDYPDEAPAVDTGPPAREVKRLRDLARDSRLSPRQRDAFLAETELDLLRKPEDRLGIEGLFIVYCRSGSRYWLNPMPWIKELDAVLFRFACRGRDRGETMTPIIGLLIDIARKGVNPTAFLQYVILPRLMRDQDWRKWRERHLESLRIIAQTLVHLREGPPFDRAVLGSGLNRLSRDIVLVKYGGRPLANAPLHELSDSEISREYRESWRKLNLDNAFTILFMKTNILNFLYHMSGRISLRQIITILTHLPEIEEAFRENFPAELYNLNLRGVDINLYDYDIAKSVRSRRDKGFQKADFIAELKAYIKVIIALLNTGAGIYLCGYFARRLAAARDPGIAENISLLIEGLQDTGGKHVYVWHAREMLRRGTDQQRGYIDYVVAHGGIDPLYPRYTELFRGQDQEYTIHPGQLDIVLKRNDITIEDIAAEAHISSEKLDRKMISWGHIINTIAAKDPARAGIIDRFKNDVTGGLDRVWDGSEAVQFDSLGPELHQPLLKTVIPGISARYGADKSSSFLSLVDGFRSGEGKDYQPVRRDFFLPAPEERKGPRDRKRNQEIRKGLDLTVFAAAWSCLNAAPGAQPGSMIRFINALFMKLREPLEKLQNRELVLRDELAGETDPGTRDKKRKEADKTLRSMTALSRQRDEYKIVLDAMADYSEDIQFLIFVMMAGARAETGDDFCLELFAHIVKRYGDDPAVEERIGYLREDVAIELLTIEQAERIINTIEVLTAKLTVEAGVILEKSSALREDLQSLMAPFIITRVKEIDAESVNAAFSRMMSFGKMTSILAKWRELIETPADSGASGIPCSLYTSKSPVDIYYGDMGGICLSMFPEVMREPGICNIRLVSHDDRQIIGMALLKKSLRGIASYGGAPGPFFHCFAINPLPSVLRRMSRKHQLLLYLQYRRVFEEASLGEGIPVVLAGISTWGIVSNDSSFADLIISFEHRFNAQEVNDAHGTAIYYTERSYSHGLVIIDPKRRETMSAEKLIEGMQKGSGGILN